MILLGDGRLAMDLVHGRVYCNTGNWLSIELLRQFEEQPPTRWLFAPADQPWPERISDVIDTKPPYAPKPPWR